ncbi:unnamed protein product [Adineta ricciae]|uniref:Nuclear receptor domain-containing protein n=1 Tax=Adineta ricciae TaxID=249248 RepID=A0A814PV52_ADIRI|nr:unnamed protein product [Adineta ricciae]CAF1111000.1 unnamed protein product [Adineta ricciae]
MMQKDLPITSVSLDVALRQKQPILRECKICGACAKYSYYGAIVCLSCKVFFRRNITEDLIKRRCDYENQCEINISNRRLCSACRLAKCFAVGMSKDMIRDRQPSNHGKNQKRFLNVPNSATLIRYKQIPALNPLSFNQSTLSREQWILLSNLTRNFDEHSGHSDIQRFVREQNLLPVKFRYRYSAVSDFFLLTMTNIQNVFEKNRDYLSLPHNDRLTLTQTTAKFTTSIGGMFLVSQRHLYNHSSFYRSAECVFRPESVATTKRIIDQFDPDCTFMKLILATIAFTTTNYTIYSESAPKLINVKAILPTQNMYIEIVWRYLLYRYNHKEAVVRLMNVVQCMLLVNNAIVEAHDSRQFIEIVDIVVEQTQQKFRI